MIQQMAPLNDLSYVGRFLLWRVTRKLSETRRLRNEIQRQVRCHDSVNTLLGISFHINHISQLARKS